MDKLCLHEYLQSNINKYEVEIKNYILPQRDSPAHSNTDSSDEKSDPLIDLYKPTESVADFSPENAANFLAFKEPNGRIKWPKICIWKYMEKSELEKLINLTSKCDVRKCIDEKIGSDHPKGPPRVVFCELMYSVVKFCKQNKFVLEQTGHVLSNFYLTHIFFTNSLQIGAEKIHNYFKEFLLAHCLPFPPESIKLFSPQEAKEIMNYFFKIYLRNVPLMRILCLPNYALYVDYSIEEEQPPKKVDKKGKSLKKGKRQKKNV